MQSGSIRKILGSSEFILFALLLVCFFPLVLGFGMLKWDALDIYLPWKFFITESLKSGELPLWNPYSSGGFAQMGDPGTWYPVSWLIGLMGTYDVSSLHCEFLVHLYLAGLGFYYLARHFNPDKYFSLMLAAAYMLSGFMIGNAQHMGWLVSATWLPFVFLQALLLLERPDLRSAAGLGFCCYLMFTGGYPPLFLSLGYILVLWMAIAIIRPLFKKNWALSGKRGAYTGLALLCFALFSLPALLGAWDLAQHITRLDPAFTAADWYLEGAPGMNSLATLFFPFTGSLLSPTLWEADFSMVNWYIGLLPLLLCFYYWGNRNRLSWLFLALAVLFLLMSLGNVLPLRSWIAQALPMMDGFRFPGVFRLFFIFFALLSVAQRSEIFQPYPRAHSFWLRSLFGLSLLCLVLAVLSWLINRDEFIGLLPWKTFLDKAGFWQRLGLQAGLSCLLLMAGVLILSRDKKLKPKVICFIGIADVALAALLNLQATVTQPFSPTDTNIALHRIAAEKAVFSVDSSYAQLTPPGGIPLLWRNLSQYYRMPSMNSYNPYQYVEIAKEEKEGHTENIREMPFVSLFDLLREKNISPGKTGMELQQFSNNSMKIRVPDSHKKLMVFNMYYHPGWKLSINGKPSPTPPKAQYGLAIPLTENTSLVELKFQPKYILPAFIISLISMLCFILLLLIPRGEPLRRQPNS